MISLLFYISKWKEFFTRGGHRSSEKTPITMIMRNFYWLPSAWQNRERTSQWPTDLDFQLQSERGRERGRPITDFYGFSPLLFPSFFVRDVDLLTQFRVLKRVFSPPPIARGVGGVCGVWSRRVWDLRSVTLTHFSSSPVAERKLNVGSFF